MHCLKGSYQSDVTKDIVVVSDENQQQNKEDEDVEDIVDQDDVLGVLEISL